MNFPIVLKTSAAEEPRASLYYAVAENGIFQVRDTPIYLAVTRTLDLIPGLLPEHEHLRLKCPRLPRRPLEDVLTFFRAVYDQYHAEAVVLLFYRVETREFRIIAPPQTLLGRRRHDGRWRAYHAVQYDNVPRPSGFVRFGTIHSHANLPAYSSGTDCADEQFEDGLHVVFGNFGLPPISVAAAFVANGVRFRLPPADVLEPCQMLPRPPRADWMARIKLEAEGLGDSQRENSR